MLRTHHLVSSASRWLRRGSLVLCGLASTLVCSAQTFVAEWNAASHGGIAPVGLALATEGGVTYLYAADQARGRVLKFNTATGAVAAAIGSAGSGDGQFNSPYGIAVHPATGDIYVAERGNHRVQRLTSAGTFVMSWGGLGTGPGQFDEPVGVAVDAAGDVYVTDHRNNRVQKFRVAQSGGAWTATPLTAWGTAGSGNGQFNLPYGIAADAAGGIWVADGFNGRVQKFDTSGTFQAVVGSAGTGPGQFIVATGVGLAPGGDVFVTSTNSNPTDGTLADAASQWVSRFTAAGAFVSRFGGAFGGGPAQFRLPFAAVVGADNRAYVSDFYNNRIQVFDLAGTTTPPPPPPAPVAAAPTITSFTLGPNPTLTTASFVVTFSEPVTGVDVADFAVNTTGTATATITGVTAGATPGTYDVAFNYSGTSGSIQMAIRTAGTGITNAAGTAFAGGGITASAAVPVNNAPPADSTVPTVASFAPGTASGSSVNFTLTFSEPVTGVDASDFLVISPDGATATLGTVAASADGVTYTIPVTFSGSGSLQLAVIGGATADIRDVATHWFAGGAGATSTAFTLPGGGGGPDTTPPTVATFAIGPAGATSVTFNLTFTEPVTGVDTADFSVVTTGGATATVGAITGSGAAYTIPVSFAGSGTVQLTLAGAGSGIVDAAGNAFTAGASGPVFTIGTTGGDGSPTDAARILSVTPPPNGTYRKGQVLTVLVKFNRGVVVDGDARRDDDDDDDDDKDEDDDASIHIGWTAVGSLDPKRDSGKFTYRGGSGTDTLVFRYKVRNGDVAPRGILFGTTLQLGRGTAIFDSSGKPLTAQQLVLPWTLNPLTGVILDAPKLNQGNHGNGNNGHGHGPGQPSNPGHGPGKPGDDGKPGNGPKPPVNNPPSHQVTPPPQPPPPPPAKDDGKGSVGPGNGNAPGHAGGNNGQGHPGNPGKGDDKPKNDDKRDDGPKNDDKGKGKDDDKGKGKDDDKKGDDKGKGPKRD